MADEDQAIAPAALETASEPAAITDEPEMIPEPGEVVEGAEAEAPVLDVVEIEWDDGKKYQIPKALEGGLLKNKDYTTKTQEVSAKAKALETRESEIEERFKASDEYIEAKAELKTVAKSLDHYGYEKMTQADWQAFSDQDPKGAGDHWRNFEYLRNQKAELEGKVGKAEADRTEKAQQDLAKRIQDTVAFAQKEIPGWKPELTDTLVKFAHEVGVPEKVLKENWSPVLYKLLHRAHIGEMALKKQTAAPAPPPIAPLATVGGRKTGTANAGLASDDMETFAAALTAKLARR